MSLCKDFLTDTDAGEEFWNPFSKQPGSDKLACVFDVK
jgi:hypothetical protein